MVVIPLLDVEGQGIVIRRRLDNTVEVIGVQTNDGGRRARILLELRSLKTHMDKDGAGIVHGRHLDPVLVEGEVHLDQDTLEGLHQRPDGSSLNCLGLYQVATAHFY